MKILYAEPNTPTPGPGRPQHSHVIYLDQAGNVFTTNNRDHKHTGVMVNGVVLLDPYPKDGHVHTVGELPNIGDEPADEPEVEVINRKLSQFQEAYDYEKESIERGREAIEFLEGEQWDSSTKAKLESEARAALTINHIAPMIESLSGTYRQNRTDIKIFPQADGDQFIADTLTHAIKQILSQNNFEYEEVEAFENQAAVGRGVIECFPEFDSNVEGNIRVQHGPWDQYLFGPHLKLDASDAEYFFRWRWMTERQLKQLFPDAFKKPNYPTPGGDQFAELGQAGEDLSGLSDATLFINPQTKEYRFMECEEKEYFLLNVYLDPSTGFVVSDLDIPKNLRSSMKTIVPGTSLQIIQQRRHRIRKTILAGSTLLDDYYPDLPQPPNATGPAFSALVAYAYKRGPVFFGKIERSKDPQREINKRRSQMVDIVNTSINNGWFVEEGQFPSKAAFEQFKRDAATAGFVVTVRDLNRPPHKVEAGQVQPGIVQLEMASLQSFREVTNVNASMLGSDNRTESGVVLQHRQRQALVGNEYLFDNMARLKKDLGRTLIQWISKIYTPRRIARLVMDQARLEAAKSQKIQIAGQPVDPNDQMLLDMIEQKLTDRDMLAYDVEVGEAGATPTTQLANLQLLMEMAGRGVPIPPQALLEVAPIPNKDKIMQMLQQAQEQQQAQESRKYDTEVTKSLIAAQSKQQKPPTPSQGM